MNEIWPIHLRYHHPSQKFARRLTKKKNSFPFFSTLIKLAPLMKEI